MRRAGVHAALMYVCENIFVYKLVVNTQCYSPMHIACTEQCMHVPVMLSLLNVTFKLQMNGLTMDAGSCAGMHAGKHAQHAQQAGVHMRCAVVSTMHALCAHVLLIRAAGRLSLPVLRSRSHNHTCQM